MSTIRLQFLGGFSASDGAGRTRLSSRNAVSLLAILSHRRTRVCERTALAAKIWDLWDPEHARASLRQTLFVIRRAFGRDIFRCDADAIGLDPAAVEVDIWEFEELAASRSSDGLSRAADLYQGPFLWGHTPGKGYAFAEWLEAERNRLRDVALDVVGRSLDEAIAREAKDVVRRAASRMLTIDPVEETGHRALMQIYAAERRYGLALRQYEMCRKTLDAELGVEPDAETRALHADIVRRRAVLPRSQARGGEDGGAGISA